MKTTSFGMLLGASMFALGIDNGAFFSMAAQPPRPAGTAGNTMASITSELQPLPRTGSPPSHTARASEYRDMVYDYRNQMVRHEDQSTGVVSTYAYDALRRRMQMNTLGNGLPPKSAHFILDGWREIEERDDQQVLRGTYVHGRYVDEVLTMDRGGTYFYHTDDLSSTQALTDTTTTVVERYKFEDYGSPWFLSPSGERLAASVVGNSFLFTGRQFDDTAVWYYYRTRHLGPDVGRFTSHDSIGIWEDEKNLGNATAYVAQNPLSRVDPFGTETIDVEVDCLTERCCPTNECAPRHGKKICHYRRVYVDEASEECTFVHPLTGKPMCKQHPLIPTTILLGCGDCGLPS